MRILLLLTLGLVSVLPATAQELVTSLLPPKTAVAPGTSALFDVVALNPGTGAATFAPPAVLNAIFIGANGRSWSAELHAVSEGSVNVGPGAFGSSRYRVNLPQDAEGRIIVEVAQTDGPPLRGVLEVKRESLAAAPGPLGGESKTGTAAATTQPASPPSLGAPPTAESNITRTFTGRISPHEPIYFIYGGDAPAAKFQFSFKYRLLSFGEQSEESPSQDSLQFAFTQRSLWDTRGNSSPFYDTSYMPELMFQSLAPKPSSNSWFTWLGYQVSLKHESNGKAGSTSRSVNRAYFRPGVQFGPADGWHVLVLPEFYAYIGEIYDNPRIKDYRGYGQLRVGVGRNDGPLLMATALAGKKFDHGTVQLDLSVPFHTKLLDFGTYLLIQYFNGYGESILAYDQKSETVRAGFSIVR